MKYMGSFLTGVASGLEMFPQIQEMKWKKEERKALEKEKEDWKEAVSVFQGKLTEYTSNTTLSYGEQIDVISAASGLGHQYMNIAQDLMSDINQGNREAAKQKHEILKAYTDFMLNSGFPIEGVETILSPDTMKYIQQGKILKETGGKTGEAMGRQTWKERGFGELPTTTETQKLTDTQVKLAEIDKLDFLSEERRNKMKVGLLSKSDSATAEKVKAIKAAGGTDEDVVKSLGGGVIGPEPTKGVEGEITSGEKRAFDMASSIMFGSSDWVTGISKPGIIPTEINTKLNMNQPLTDEDKSKVRNNYNAIKDTLPDEVKNIVESQLKRYGISLEAPTPTTPEPTITPEPEPKKWWEFWKSGEEKPTTDRKLGPLTDMKGKPIKDYSAMTEEELYKLAMAGDKEAYEEAKRRGLIK